jgi:hypothetical protein
MPDLKGVNFTMKRPQYRTEFVVILTSVTAWQVT